MTMQTPEIGLTELNRALLRLRGASASLLNAEMESKLNELMRRLLLAEVLGNTWIIAVGGSQGAGKTSLMASLYDCPDWLAGNEGRGEKLPVLIQEEKLLTAPQGYVRRLVKDDSNNSFSLNDVKCEIAEFKKAICDPDSADLLPLLKVPPRYFQRENQAWLLLPGYEVEDRKNKAWQALMRQAMVAAGGCVVVTDETRMANSEQVQIVKDMLENELKHCRPYIVISKTEAHRGNDDKQKQLRNSAKETFQIPDELANTNIVLTGTTNVEYIKEWMPLFKNAVTDLSVSGQSSRGFQMKKLADLLREELPSIINSIKAASRLHFKGGASDGKETVDEIMDEFDYAVESLKAVHHQKVADLASSTLTNACDKLKEYLRGHREGFGNWSSNLFETHSEEQIEMQRAIKDCWKKANPQFFAQYSKELGGVTIKKLGGPIQDDSGPLLLKESEKGSAYLEKLKELGYVDELGRRIRLSGLNKDAVSDIKILLDSPDAKEQNASKQMHKSVKLIPALSLEYARMSYVMPEIYGLNADFSLDKTATGNLVADGVESLGDGMKLGKTAIESIAGLFAADVITDGDSDILGALTASGSAIAMHPAAVAATATVAAAYITTKAITGLRTIEKKFSVHAHNMLISVHDQHLAHLNEQFNNTMSVVRERVYDSLSERYRLGEVFMEKDRLAKALADVSSFAHDLRSEIGSAIDSPFLVAVEGE